MTHLSNLPFNRFQRHSYTALPSKSWGLTKYSRKLVSNRQEKLSTRFDSMTRIGHLILWWILVLLHVLDWYANMQRKMRLMSLSIFYPSLLVENYPCAKMYSIQRIWQVTEIGQSHGFWKITSSSIMMLRKYWTCILNSVPYLLRQRIFRLWPRQCRKTDLIRLQKKELFQTRL